MAALNARYLHTNLAVRCIKAASGEFKNEIVIEEFTINQPEDEILSLLYTKKPDIVGFSCYIWNIGKIMMITEHLKMILPGVKVVLGGPEVSFDAQDVLQKCPADVVVAGPGEEPFYQLLKAWDTNCSLKGIKNICYRENERVQINASADPVHNLQYFPYEKEEDIYSNRIIYYETQRGCPFQCAYCLSGGKGRVIYKESRHIFKELDFFLQKKLRRVKLVDRTFNCNKEHAMMIWQYLKEHDNEYTNFHFEIAGDLLDDQMLAFLENARPELFQFEIGIQSTNETTLKAIHRKTNLRKAFANIKKLLEFKNIHIHLDLIAGLPQEDIFQFKQSFNDVFAVRPHQLQLGFLKLLKGSPLWEKKEEYGIKHKKQAPYEILTTNWLNYQDIIALKSVEHLLSLYYNSGLAPNTIELLLQAYASPYRMFEELVLYCQKNNYLTVPHKKEKLFEILYKFFLSMQPRHCTQEQAADTIKFDMLQQDPVHQLPDWMPQKEPRQLDLEKTFQRSFYNNEALIQQYAPELSGLTPTQRARQTAMAWLSLQFTDNMLKPVLFLYHRKAKSIDGKATYVIIEEEL